MMKKKLILILITAIFLISCTDNDDEIIIDADLVGLWSLNNASCFCFFGDDFDFSAHQLNFSNTAALVTIVNSEDTSFITTSGEYSYTIAGNILTINNSLKYTYEVTGNTLVLTFVDNPQIADDEITLTYAKQ